MNTTTPELRDLARSILADSASLPESSSDASVAVCRKFCEPMVKLAGEEGFRALLSRALSLATRQEPLLSGLRVSPEGALERVESLPPQTSEPRWTEAQVLLIAQVLGLLATFIGHALTSRLVKDNWPNLDNGPHNENIS